MNDEKLQEVFSDKEYVESILKMTPEDAARSLCEKGVEVTAQDLIQVRDLIVTHQDELANGELSEEMLTAVSGGVSAASAVGKIFAVVGASAVVSVIIAAAMMLW